MKAFLFIMLISYRLCSEYKPLQTRFLVYCEDLMLGDLEMPQQPFDQT